MIQLFIKQNELIITINVITKEIDNKNAVFRCFYNYLYIKLLKSLKKIFIALKLLQNL